MTKTINLNTTLKIVGGLLLVFIIYELNRTYSLYYPDHLFEYEVPYRNFDIYTNRPVDSGVYEMMEEAIVRASALEHFTADENYHIYLIGEPDLFGSFAERLGMSPYAQGLTIQPLGYILVNLNAIERTAGMYDREFPHTLLQGDTVHIITHELMHALTAEQLGFWATRSLPAWKSEGFAEYGASLATRRRDSTYSLPAVISQYLSGYYDSVSAERKKYVKHRMMVEYLMDYRGLGFRELMNGSFDPDSVFAELTGLVSRETGTESER